jgi:phosphoribulokinase
MGPGLTVRRNHAVTDANGASRRATPVMVGIVGDSAAGKTTLTRGIASIFGEERVTVICADDYHRYDREARKTMTITPLNPECNYMEIMEQHLALLAAGEPILKPIYNHGRGTLDAPEVVTPREIVIVEGLLGFHSRAMRESFDVKVYLDPAEDMRARWKVERDCSKRGYETDEVLRQLHEREPDSAAFIRPQRQHADIVVRFHPPGASLDFDRALLNVKLVLRPSLPHPYLLEVAESTRVDHVQPVRVSLARDHGKPVDLLEVEGSVRPDVSAAAEQAMWRQMHHDGTQLDTKPIGVFQQGDRIRRSESLALTQLLLVYQLMSAKVARWS